jgi:hypothetical protein
MAFTRILIAAALSVGFLSVATAACEAQSGSSVTALVELYTSEGCSSCPPADRRMAQLRQGTDLVPLALHVHYWDDLGWQDPFAQADFARRQSWLVRLAGQSTVYTPQFFVGGREARPATLDARVRELNGQAPQASIRLLAHLQGEDTLAIRARARSPIDSAALYVALAESGLSSRVRAGENGGRRLHHDHVVRVWIGPPSLRDGSADLRRSLPLATYWQRSRLELSAFVQDQRTGRVLQAVGVGGCAGA